MIISDLFNHPRQRFNSSRIEAHMEMKNSSKVAIIIGHEGEEEMPFCGCCTPCVQVYDGLKAVGRKIRKMFRRRPKNGPLVGSQPTERGHQNNVAGDDEAPLNNNVAVVVAEDLPQNPDVPVLDENDIEQQVVQEEVDHQIDDQVVEEVDRSEATRRSYGYVVITTLLAVEQGETDWTVPFDNLYRGEGPGDISLDLPNEDLDDRLLRIGIHNRAYEDMRDQMYHVNGPRTFCHVLWKYRLNVAYDFRDLFASTAQSALEVSANAVGLGVQIDVFPGYRRFPSVVEPDGSVWLEVRSPEHYNQLLNEYFDVLPQEVLDALDIIEDDQSQAGASGFIQQELFAVFDKDDEHEGNGN